MLRRIYVFVSRRAVPAGLVVTAALADGAGSARIAFYAFLVLVAVTAVTALNAYGELVEAPPAPEEATPRRLQALLWGVLLAFALLGAVSRAPLVGEGGVPRLAVTAVVACLLLLLVEAIVELIAQARRPAAPRATVTPLPLEAQSGSDEAASLARSING